MFTVKKVEIEELENREGKTQEKPVIYFKEIEKGFVCNRTNWSIIEKIHGPESDNWVNKPITLFVLDVEAFGEMVQAIRVKPPRRVVAKPTVPPAAMIPLAAAMIPPDDDVITQYWGEVKRQGLERKQGLQLLKEHGDDFEKAIKALLAGDSTVSF